MVPLPVQLAAVEGEVRGFGDLDHWVRVMTTPDGRVEGSVTLFGSVTFSVDLGRAPKGASFARAYRVDQFERQQRVDDELDLSAPFESARSAQARSFEDFCALAQEQATALCNRALVRQKRLWLDRTIQKCFEEAGVKPGECLDNDDQAWLFAGLVASRLVDELLPAIKRAAQERNVKRHLQQDSMGEREKER